MTAIKIICVLFFSITSLTSGIYNYSVSKIEGGSQLMSSYEGKKIMVITLPVVQDAVSDSMLYALDTLAAAHQSNLAVIAVPSYEDGYTTAIKQSLQQWYRSKLGNYILITEGLYTRKTSASQQHGLFKWLTYVNENFEIDVEGPGYKYFVRGNGELYGVLKSHVRISSMAVNRTIQMQ